MSAKPKPEQSLELAIAVEESKPAAPKAETPAPAQPAKAAAPASTGQSAAEEMECFISVLTGAFVPAKEARSALKHPENITRAAAFAEALAAAFKTLKSPQS